MSIHKIWILLWQNITSNYIYAIVYSFQMDFEEVFTAPEYYDEMNIGKAMNPIVKKVFGTVYDVTQVCRF